MPQVTVFNDPAGINDKHTIDLDRGQNLLDWLIETYGPDGFAVPTQCYRNGHIIDSNLIDLQSHTEDGCPLGDDEHIVIVHCPQGFDPLTIAGIFFVIGVAAAVILAPNIPILERPGQERATESPNNRLTGQTNIARPLQRIPDLYGKNKIWPDLIAKTHFEFISNRKFVTEFLCVGRGEYLLEDLKSGETLISDITGASSTIFGPSTAPAVILDVTESSIVDGQQIFAPNSTDIISFNSGGFFQTAVNDTIVGASSDFLQFSAGEQFAITNTVSNNGTFTFVSAVNNILGTTVVVQETAFVDETDLSFQVDAVAGASSVVGPFVVPGGTEDVWFDLLFLNGLGDRTSGSMVSLTIDFDLILERLDAPGGSVIGTETTGVSVTGSSIEQVFNTFKVAPDFPGDPYQAKVERQTNTTEDANFLDNSKWGRLAGVEDLGGINFGNITTVLIVTKATEQSVKTQERKFNALATRKLRTYNTSTGLIVPALTATKKMADAMLEHLTDEFLGNKNTADIDLDGLYEIQDDLDVDAIYGDKLGRFSFTFSDQSVSVGDELVTIGNAARTFAFRDGNIFRFGREETKVNRTTIFNARIKKPDSESKTKRLQKPLDFDGIEIQWIPEDSNDAEIIIFPETGPAPENPRKLEAAGIKVYEQAWNRAKLEFLKLKHVRETVETLVNKRGLLVTLNDRVGNVDGTNVKAQGGELAGFSGLTIETSDPIDFKGSGSGFAIINDESGNPSSAIVATPRTDGVNGFILASALAFFPVLRGDNDNQIASLYNFFIDGDDKTAKDYTIQEIRPQEDGFVSLSMTNYAPEIFAPDTETPTPQT